MSILKNKSGDVHFWPFPVALVLLVVLLVSAVGYGPVRWSCANKAEALGVPYRWSLTTDCLVEWNGRYVPLENLRFTDTDEVP